MAVTTYDFRNTSVLVNGTRITGWADGDAIQIEKREDAVELLIGAEGDGEYTDSADASATVTLTLLSTSPSSNYLEDLYEAGETFDLQIIDKNENARNRAASDCRIQTFASLTRGMEASPREWVILTPKLTRS